MQEPKAGRRIVSKGAYTAIRIGQNTMYVSGIVLMAFSGLCALTAVACGLHLMRVIGLLVTTQDRMQFISIGLYGMGMGMSAGIAFLLGKSGYMAVTKAEKLMDGVPLTRETADLPAPDSLVRASQEPAQIQERVLLRAASGEAQAGQEEQLLRASVGGQE